MAKNKFDYNRDNQVDAADQQLADMDKDGNRRVSEEERKAYYAEQGKSTTSYTYDADGNIISEQTKTAVIDDQVDISAGDLGYVPAFLKQHKEIRDAIAKAIKYDWTEQQFINYVERETNYGKTHTAAQELFDMRSVDPAYQKEYETSIANKTRDILQAAATAGVSMTNAAAKDFAVKAIRNQLDDTAVRAFVAKGFDVTQKPEEFTGTAADISARLKQYAGDYGVTLTDDQLGPMIRQGLKQPNVDQWLSSKENIFRSQAKTIYGNISDLLDTMTTADVLAPYIGIAAQTLGLNARTMKVTDPRWTKAFQGDNGVMSNEEWMRTLKTDSTYGYSKTQNAKVEASQIAKNFMTLLGG